MRRLAGWLFDQGHKAKLAHTKCLPRPVCVEDASVIIIARGRCEVTGGGREVKVGVVVAYDVISAESFSVVPLE